MSSTTTSRVPSQPSLISRLWYDKENRSIIVQILAALALLWLFGSMILNAIHNLEVLGKGFSFNFLWQPASYDINQTLIEYTSRSSHFRAMLVGIINTLLVAFAGVVLATILGFILGVLRLSKNWLVNKMAYCYIEYVRNVPVLLHILLIHGVIVHSLPRPKQAINIGDTTFLTNRGVFMPSPEFLPMFKFVAAAAIIGIIFTWGFRRYAKSLQESTGKQLPVFWVSLVALLGLPVAAYFFTGQPVAWDIPALSGFNYKGGMVVRPEFLALWLALSFYTAAFIAEIVRAGILAVNHGQTEASMALGLPRNRTLNLVVIPQALRVIVPPLSSQYLNLTKNSSLAIAIGYMDVTATIGGISLNQTGREMECMIIVMGIYLTFSLLISAGMNWYNNRIALVER
jgi:general L-amino acid transport system permease protein